MKTVIGDCELHLGDCADVMDTFDVGSIDTIMTDPPYIEEFLPTYEALAIGAKRVVKFVGIEIVQKYFDMACRRIEEVYRQPDFFRPTPAKITQEKFL